MYMYLYYHRISHSIEHSNNKNPTTYGIGNPGPGFGQAQTSGRVKPVNGIPTFLSLEIGSQKAIQI
jgi:hypothetical protein